jgi:hypothetical protein
MRNDQKAAQGTIYLQTGGSGIKQGSLGVMFPYQEVQSAPGISVFSAITVTNDRIIVETKKVDANGETPVVTPYQRFEIIKANTHGGLYRWNVPYQQEYRLAG